jgi:cob(I)alamin adenosyltransferase
MTRYYTGTGDDGYTGILGGERVPKYHPRPAAVGALDEATAAMGLVRAGGLVSEAKPLILEMQRDLYHLMGEVAAAPEHAARFRKVGEERVAWLEAQTDRFGQAAALPTGFIVPGDSLGGAYAALARTAVRRAERHMAELLHDGLVENPHLLRYLNRLSSFLFVLELHENQAAGQTYTTLAKKDQSA